MALENFNTCRVNNTITIPFVDLSEFIPRHNPKVKVLNLKLSGLTAEEKEFLENNMLDPSIYDLLYTNNIEYVVCSNYSGDVILATDKYTYLSEFSFNYAALYESWELHCTFQTGPDYIGG